MLFGLLTNINKGLEEYQNTPGSVLVDVREADEYASGHIPGAVNLPLSMIDQETLSLPKDKMIFVYCLSGMRSRQAVKALSKKGYKVKNIGGISSYKGTKE